MKLVDTLNKNYYNFSKKGNVPNCTRVLILILSSWIFQGSLYMDKTEKIFKFFVGIIFFLFVYLLFQPSSVIDLTKFLFISHSLNWIFNSNVNALIVHIGLRKNSKDFLEYLNNLVLRSQNEKSILSIILLGSSSTDSLKISSDLDIRIIRRSGFFNGVRSCLFCMSERTRATLKAFPLDIYVFDNIGRFSDFAEEPLIIYDADLS